MTAKLRKYYDNLFGLSKIDVLSEGDKLYEHISFFIDYDFDEAGDIWEYLLETHANELRETPAAVSLIDKVIDLFTNKSANKTSKLLIENSSLRNFVCLYSPNAGQGFTQDLIAQLLVSNKLDAAEDFLKIIARNNNLSIGYNCVMRELIDLVIDEIRIRAAQKSITVKFPKRLIELLTVYVNKIKGSEKQLLLQKLKEVS